jgi:hypothetical protein
MAIGIKINAVTAARISNDAQTTIKWINFEYHQQIN